MTRPLRAFRDHYAASPLHLLAMLGAFAVAGYAAFKVVDSGQWPRIAIWFAGAVIAHDLVLFPLYSLADGTLLRRGGRRPFSAYGVRATNYLRVPLLLSLLLLLLWFPLIFGLSSGFYRGATGLGTDPYLPRWLAVSGVLLLGSALLYAAAVARARRRRTAPSTTIDASP